ncbi:MAG: 30S ribosomal protein S5 [Patescibacteria group bacterium]
MPGKRGTGKPKREKSEFDQQVIDLSRVTRVTKGGKHLSFRACVLIGDRHGRIGFGLDKGKDVQMAVEKAVNQAKKHLIRVPIIRGTIPHRVEAKFKSGRVMIKPAPPGSGIIAGSSLRSVLEMAGIQNASAKMISKTHNRVVNLKATFEALQKFRPDAREKAARMAMKKI